jgi:NTE family protein
MTIGLALSGGGARGIAHIGAIKALEDMDVKISMVSGTSAGSIVAALLASGYKADEMLDIIQHVSIFRSFRPAWTLTGLLTMEGLKEVLHKYIPQNSFESLKMPLAVAATEIRKGHITYFTAGELFEAVVASCSIPAIFNPVSFNGGLYVDGGLLDNMPVHPLREKCDFIIGSHCNHMSHDFDPRNLKLVVERTMLMAIHTNTQISAKMCDVIIEPPRMDRFTTFDIGKAKEIFDFSYQYTKENFLPHHFQKTAAA